MDAILILQVSERLNKLYARRDEVDAEIDYNEANGARLQQKRAEASHALHEVRKELLDLVRG